MAREVKSASFLEQLEAQNDQLKHIRKELAYDLSRLRQRHNELLKKSNAHHTEKLRLKNLKAKADTEHAEMLSEVQDASEKVESSRSRLSQLQAEVKERQETNEALVEKIKRHHSTNANILRELEQVRQALKKQQETQTLQQKRLLDLRQNREAAESKLQQARTILRGLEVQAQQIAESTSAEEAKLEELREALSKHVADKAAAEQKISDAQITKQRVAARSHEYHQEALTQAVAPAPATRDTPSQPKAERHMPTQSVATPNPILGTTKSGYTPQKDAHFAQTTRAAHSFVRDVESATSSRDVDPQTIRRPKRARGAAYRSPRLVRRQTPTWANSSHAVDHPLLSGRSSMHMVDNPGEHRSSYTGPAQAAHHQNQGLGQRVNAQSSSTARSLRFEECGLGSNPAAVPDFDQLFGPSNVGSASRGRSRARGMQTQAPAGGSASNSKVTSGSGTPLGESLSTSSSAGLYCVPALPASSSSSSPELQHRQQPSTKAKVIRMPKTGDMGPVVTPHQASGGTMGGGLAAPKEVKTASAAVTPSREQPTGPAVEHAKLQDADVVIGSSGPVMLTPDSQTADDDVGDQLFF